MKSPIQQASALLDAKQVFADARVDDVAPAPTATAGLPTDEQQLDAQRTRDKLLDVYAFSADINERRYGLYTWCEDKIKTLVTVDSILYGALFIILGKDNVFPVVPGMHWHFLAVAGAFASLTASLVISIWHIEPKMDSKVGNIENPRTSIGINSLSKDEYFARLMSLELQDMIKYNAWQIKGMNKIIMKNQRAIRVAVLCTILGVAFFSAIVTGADFR